ncbi:MAG: secretin N-terminal domain-containing protein [Thermoanaerobaculia bacterium]
MTPLTRAVILLATLSLASCTSYTAYRKGQELIKTGQYDTAVTEFEKALNVDPDNAVYKLALDNARLEASRQHFEKGKLLAGAGQLEMAATEFELAARLDGTNQYAAVELLKAQRKIQELRLRERGTFEDVKKQAKALGKAQPPQLDPGSSDPISLSFPTETNIKDIYKALGNAFGINILFDQAVKDDRISIELRDVTAQQALERVMQAGNQFYKVLDEKTLIVIPDNPQSRRDYEDLVIQTFYLSNGDAEQVTNVVRTMIEARNVFPLKALNAITIRDTADKVRIAEKIIEANDKAKAEVVIQVELLQVDASKLQEIGAAASLQGRVLPVDDAGNVLVQEPMDVIQSLTSDNLTFTLPTATYAFTKSRTNAKLLAKPQLRISEGEKATLHIGQKQPIPVSTLFTSSVPGQNQGPITSYQYQDIGIKISIEPRVHHNREITLKLTVEVSNIAGAVPGDGNSPDQPIIGTRTIESTIRLQDGETNFLAGLYRQDDSSTKKITPFLGDLPLIGRLFTQEGTTYLTTDLVLTMTPHIIRIPDVTADDLAPMWVGTQNNLSFRGVSPRLESPTQGDPFNSFPRQQAPPSTEQPPPPPPETDPNTSQPNPNVPSGGGPSNPFVGVPRPITPPPPNSGGSDEKRLVVGQDPVVSFSTPRIGLEPPQLPIGFGTEQTWRVVGMDLDGLVTESLEILYDNATLDIADVVFGSALVIDPVVPPAITVDRAAGRIRVASTDATVPLSFKAGGEILVLRVRGLAPGDGFVMLDGLVLRGADGRRTPVALAGGRSAVR